MNTHTTTTPVQLTMPDAVGFLLRDGVAVVFLAAGGAKLGDRAAFQETILALRLPLMRASRRRARAGSFILPLIECALGGLLLVGVWPRSIDLAALAVLAVFAVLTAFAITRRRGTRCRCFGHLSASQFTPIGLARLAVLIVALLIPLLVSNLSLPSPSVTEWFPLIACAGLLAVACASASQTLEFIRERRI